MYKFDPSGQSTEAAFRAIALSQLDEALADLDKGDADGRSVVHEARRRCKKLRGLLRLVRPAFPDYARENAAIRDAAALLSHLRDAEVLHQTVNDSAQMASKSEALERMSGGWRRASRRPISSGKLGRVPRPAAGGARRVPRLVAEAAGRDALLPGSRLTYRNRPASAWRGATRTRHRDRFPRVAQGQQISRLPHRPAQAERRRTCSPMTPRWSTELSTLLGQHHDLTVLGDAVGQDAGRFGGRGRRGAARGDRRAHGRAARDGAFALGRQILAETPRAVAARFPQYWKDAA